MSLHKHCCLECREELPCMLPCSLPANPGLCVRCAPQIDPVNGSPTTAAPLTPAVCSGCSCPTLYACGFCRDCWSERSRIGAAT